MIYLISINYHMPWSEWHMWHIIRNVQAPGFHVGEHLQLSLEFVHICLVSGSLDVGGNKLNKSEFNFRFLLSFATWPILQLFFTALD